MCNSNAALQKRGLLNWSTINTVSPSPGKCCPPSIKELDASPHLPPPRPPESASGTTFRGTSPALDRGYMGHYDIMMHLGGPGGLVRVRSDIWGNITVIQTAPGMLG